MKVSSFKVEAKSRLFQMVDGIRKSSPEQKKSFEKRFGLELALLYLYHAKPSDAQYW